MKKTMTRILTLALALAMSATMVACNNGGQTSSGSDSSAAESANESAAENNGEEITITYAFWGSEDDISEDSVAARFSAENDRINVEEVPIPWETYIEKLNAMSSAGNLPDTAIMSESAVIQWASEGMLLDIADMYGEGEAKPLDSTAFTYDGKTVAYGAANNALVMFYNKDMFDAANVEYPPTNADEAWSWDEFVEVAKQLTLDTSGRNANDPSFDAQNIAQYGCMVENLTWQLEVWCRSNGGGFYNDDGTEVTIGDPASIEAIQKVADLYLVDKVAPLSAGLTDDGVSRSVIAGTCAMTTNGAWNIGTTLGDAKEEGLNYGIAVLPYMKDKVTISTAGPNVVFSTTEHPEEAMEWIRYYMKEENSWDLISAGTWMPILESYYTDEAMTKKWLENPNYPEYDEAKPVLVDYVMEYAKPTSWNYTNHTTDFNALLGSVLGNVWTGDVTAEQAINENLEALKAAHDGN